MTEELQVLLLLDLATANPLSENEVLAHLPDRRLDRRVLRLSSFGVRGDERGAPLDDAAAGLGLRRMISAARKEAPAGAPVHYYVAGRAALSQFVHLGTLLQRHARVTLIAQRPDKTWDVFSPSQQSGSFEPFFPCCKGLDAQLDSPADGYVALHLGTMAGADRDGIKGAMREVGLPLAGIAELSWAGGPPLVLDEKSAPRAQAQIMDALNVLHAAYPRKSGLALFIAGPTGLALQAGLAINFTYFGQVAVFDRRPQAPPAPPAYVRALLLPDHSAPRYVPRDEDQPARLLLLREAQEALQLLKERLSIAVLPPFLPWLDQQQGQRLLDTLGKLSVAKEPRGEGFDLRPDHGALTFGASLLDGVGRLAAREQASFVQMFILHELVHDFAQGLLSANSYGIGRAGVALEDVDFWADAFAFYTMLAMDLAEGGKQAARALPERAVALLDTALRGMQVFDRMSQPERMERLSERRLRRYLTWHLMRARAKTLPKGDDAAPGEKALQRLFGERLIVELAPFRGVLDEETQQRLVVEANQDTNLFIVLAGRLHRLVGLPGLRMGDLVERVRDYDPAGALDLIMTNVRDSARELLTPWAR